MGASWLLEIHSSACHIQVAEFAVGGDMVPQVIQRLGPFGILDSELGDGTTDQLCPGHGDVVIGEKDSPDRIAIPTTGANPLLFVPLSNQVLGNDTQAGLHINFLGGWITLDERRIVNGRWHQ